ncbi:MAG: DUF1549 domain-containing protein, partial [Acidobacteria bacterium]|nr:DUF1549 domain-containing protein [Acidobacteriota bacterium]
MRLPVCLFALVVSAQAVDFNRDIRPILSDNCFACYGPDDKQRKAGLRLDTREGAFAKAGLIAAGDAAHSRLFLRVNESKARRMPPAWAGMPALTAHQIDLVRQWINDGAKWETHWAYAPPKRAETPKVSKPGWVRNPVDAFILARLDKEALKPSPEAGRATLIRRVTYDLTGLPPAPAEVDAFLKDKSPAAYEKVVDRLLASPHYGERMAMQWLDFARYADTHGYHIDSHRDMWPWRDWVIRAFNGNERFDQFTVEQLAGDLLPSPTRDQLIATGFNRNHMINFEGGAIPEEYQVEYVVDRVEATANTWMGMTMGCARCHDHKYDPIKQRDFYRFFAFFNTVSEKGLDGRRGNADPMLPLPTPEQAANLARVKQAIEAHQQALPEAGVAEAQRRWEVTAIETLARPTRQGLLAHYAFDGSLADSSGNYRDGRAITNDVTFSPGMVNGAAEFDGETEARIADPGPFDAGGPFSVALHVRGSTRESAVMQKVDAAGRGFEVSFGEQVSVPIQKRYHPLIVSLTAKAPDQAIRVRTRNRLPQNEWSHVAITYDGSAKAAGIQIYFNGKLEPGEVLDDRLSGGFETPVPLTIGNRKSGRPFRGRMDDLRFYDRALLQAEIEQLAIDEPTRATLLRPEAVRSKDQKDRLREYFLTRSAPDSYRKLYAGLNELKKQKEQLDELIPNTMVMRELDKPRPTFVLARGDYRNQTEKVTPGVPAVLPPLEKDAPLNRLTLARWLVDPSHPLTARVAVNRYWQMYFGQGIVKTS